MENEKNKKDELKRQRNGKGGFGRRVPKTEDYPNGWEELLSEEVNLSGDKPIVLALPGGSANMTQGANAMCKYVEGFVDESQSNGYDMYGFYYGVRGAFDEDIKKEVVATFIEPLLKDENGNLYDKETIKKNLSRLKIAAYCRGATVAQDLLNAAAVILMDTPKNKKDQKQENQENKTQGNKKDERPGCSDDEIKDLLGHVFVVAYEPESSLTYGKMVGFYSHMGNWPQRANKKDDMTIAEVQEISENEIDVVSDNFVDENNDEDHALNTLQKYIKHDDYVPGDKRGLVKRKGKDYTREQAFADMFGSMIAYGYTTSDVNLDDVKMILEAQINSENKIVFEKELQQKMKAKKEAKKKNTQASTEDLAQA